MFLLSDGGPMKEFFQRKGVSLSAKVYFIDALSSMALGLFSSLIIGLIIKTIGEGLGINYLIEIGTLAMNLMGPAIGIAVAYALKAPPLVLFAAILAGAAGNELGGPAGSYLAAVIATEVGKLISKETKLDIIITPFITIFTGYTVAAFIGPGIDFLMKSLGGLIMWGTEQRPIIMGIVVAVIMGLALTAPISSAAIALMLDLHGLAAGAATIGCSAQMVGFAISSFRENKVAGLFAVGIGTSMLLVTNIIRNPYIIIPPTIAGAVMAPLGTTLLTLHNNAAGAGMGTSGLVGQIMTFTTMGLSWEVVFKVLILHIIGPALISLLLSEYMRKKGLIKLGDMQLQTGGDSK